MRFSKLIFILFVKQNLQLVNNSTGSLSLHENSSQGYSIQYNKSNWNVEDNAAAGYGEPSTSFQNKQYPNDIAVTVSINPWNGGDFQNFAESVSGMMTLLGVKVTEINQAQKYLSASGFNTNYNKMNIGRMYYSPGRSMAVDIIYSSSMEGSQQLKEAVAMMKSAIF